MWHVVFKQRQKWVKLSQNGQEAAHRGHKGLTKAKWTKRGQKRSKWAKSGQRGEKGPTEAIWGQKGLNMGQQEPKVTKIRQSPMSPKKLEIIKNFFIKKIKDG